MGSALVLLAGYVHEHEAWDHNYEHVYSKFIQTCMFSDIYMHCFVIGVLA